MRPPNPKRRLSLDSAVYINVYTAGPSYKYTTDDGPTCSPKVRSRDAFDLFPIYFDDFDRNATVRMQMY
jgi:hypothetical protein